VVIKEGDNVSIRRKGLIEQYSLGSAEPFTRVHLKEIGTLTQLYLLSTGYPLTVENLDSLPVCTMQLI
jgi:hypothetical protein